MPFDSLASPLTSHLGYWLRYVSNHVSHAFARRLEAEDVTVAEWTVMRTLYDEDDISPSRLADQMGLTRGAISKLADRLIAKGLIAREENQDDRRAHSLRLSPPGRDLVPKLSALADENDREFFDHLSAQERASLERVLKAIIEQRGLKTIPLA
ncbi:MarR family winged helix-turn-helix transcriptional regulator [Phenylobacterium montanum]|uniref:MarR family transcriptional regulator n=1 Tax=Phenylobacterium montanum TaxID=2823693 RepID=A0A975G166_9CAUL|nr:MarR family transcriptional regulator [Caulobacter sp. S6]QUD88658.1 MarR family transcriptional regulator [Caulobacter sp. S6]